MSHKLSFVQKFEVTCWAMCQISCIPSCSKFITSWGKRCHLNFAWKIFWDRLINLQFFIHFQVIRQNCESFSTQGLPSFPTGLPFTYWEQYIYLHGYLWMAVGIVLAATLVVLSLALMNLWAALIVVSIIVRFANRDTLHISFTVCQRFDFVFLLFPPLLR